MASPRNATRRFILQKTRRKLSCPRHLAGPWFQVLFHSPRRGSFRLSLTVLYAIGSSSVFSLGSWSTRIRTGFLVPRPTQVPHHGAAFIPPTGLSPSMAVLSGTFRYECGCFTPRVIPMRPYNPGMLRFGLLRVRSPLLAESLLISFPRLLRWFTSPGVAPPDYSIHPCGACIAACGLPHSGIRESLDVCSYPRLFAACRALLRLTAPRHPPWTYLSLDHIIFSSRHSTCAPSGSVGLRPSVLALVPGLHRLCFPSLVVSNSIRPGPP